MIIKRKIKNLTLITLAASIVFHLLALGIVSIVDMFKAKSVVPQTVEITLLPSPKKTPLPTSQKQKRKRVKIENQQIVQQNEQAVNQETPDSKYLSKNNQKVLKQTQSKNQGKFNNTAGKNKLKSKLKNANSKPGVETKSIAKKKASPPKKPSKMGLKNLIPKFDYQKENNFKPQAVSGGGPQQSQSNDYLPEVKDGNQTLLSTKEFKYYTYFERIRSKIRYYWEPVIKDKVKHYLKTGRQLASADHKTTVIITLDNSGSLVNVQVTDGSGVRDLDEAAIEAFRAAEPFPNPPKGLADPSNGKIEINWNFILEARKCLTPSTHLA